MKPMLAATLKSSTLHKITYPKIVSPKVDGIRCLMHPDRGPVTRKLIAIPNNYIRKKLRALAHDCLPDCLDGELVVGKITAPDVMSATQSGVMSFDGEPRFTYWVFDTFAIPHLTYRERFRMCKLDEDTPRYVKRLESKTVYNEDELLEMEEAYLARGFEGIMIREPGASYKFGRSTLREQGLVKFKRFEDAEAVVINYKEKYVNHNDQERDELGYAKRSSAKAGKVAAGVLGALVCRSTMWDSPFDVGSGFNDEQRVGLWRIRDTLVGRKVKFKFQAIGVKDRPRFPIFLGFRRD